MDTRSTQSTRRIRSLELKAATLAILTLALASSWRTLNSIASRKQSASSVKPTPFRANRCRSGLGPLGSDVGASPCGTQPRGTAGRSWCGWTASGRRPATARSDTMGLESTGSIAMAAGRAWCSGWRGRAIPWMYLQWVSVEPAGDWRPQGTPWLGLPTSSTISSMWRQFSGRLVLADGPARECHCITLGSRKPALLWKRPGLPTGLDPCGIRHTALPKRQGVRSCSTLERLPSD
jgi:hypothetical protein